MSLMSIEVSFHAYMRMDLSRSGSKMARRIGNNITYMPSYVEKKYTYPPSKLIILDQAPNVPFHGIFDLPKEFSESALLNQDIVY